MRLECIEKVLSSMRANVEEDRLVNIGRGKEPRRRPRRRGLAV